MTTGIDQGTVAIAAIHLDPGRITLIGHGLVDQHRHAAIVVHIEEHGAVVARVRVRHLDSEPFHAVTAGIIIVGLYHAVLGHTGRAGKFLAFSTRRQAFGLLRARHVSRRANPINREVRRESNVDLAGLHRAIDHQFLRPQAVSHTGQGQHQDENDRQRKNWKSFARHVSLLRKLVHKMR
jgi:hypothetical protein